MADDFKFQIGDVLAHKAMIVDPPLPAAPRLFVVDREEFPVSKKPNRYLCRLVGPVRGGCEIVENCLWFAEVELAPYGDWAEAARKAASEEGKIQRLVEAVEAADLARGRVNKGGAADAATPTE